jgi:hypothetical protein
MKQAVSKTQKMADLALCIAKRLIVDISVFEISNLALCCKEENVITS